MASTINVTSSCKFLYIKSNAYTAGATTGEITITDVQTGTDASSIYTLTYNGTNNFGQVLINTADLPSSGRGVFRLSIRENGGIVAKKLVLIKCDIDCCLVKLTNELIDCECDCAKCASSLAKAQKIFLLLHSSETAVENYNTLSNEGYALDAMNKYKKAKEICDASCGCDC